MELNRDPLWDEQGRLRRGCTVREALAWLTKCGSLVGRNSAHSASALQRKLRSAPFLPPLPTKSADFVGVPNARCSG